ncbi:uncharacterized protein [Eucyclogobius newberryi]|uniref:uncharacterized protein n=1 Tax=Eucyclogobius newberryi TaxID=166745 RepID=UPI003B5999A6
MDSWTLQGDSYSFLRSAPRNFSLCHRDGTPNHVEIFDIISTPSQRSVISETTCLCDIFGDDCEAASLSSSPTSAAFSPQLTEVEGRAVASPTVDDNNDSSGSYHTAHSSSEEEELLEDPNQKQNCAELQSVTEDQTPSKPPGKTNTAHCTISPAPQERAESPDLKILPSPENNTTHTHSPEGSCRSLSSSLADVTYSPSPSSSRKDFSETESRSTTPASKDRHSGLSHQTPTPESRNCVSSSPSVTTQPDFWELSSEPGNICKTTSPSSELQSNNLITQLNFQPKVIVSSTDILSSPQPELTGRISVHDLFSRVSTPDLEDHPQTPEPDPSPINAEEDITVFAETDIFSLKTKYTVSTPDLQYTSSSPVNSSTSSPEPWNISSEIIRLNSPSPSRLSSTSPHSITTRSPTTPLSPQENYISSRPASGTSLYSPVVTSLSPSPGCSPIVCVDKAASPEIRITASSPEVEDKPKRPVSEPHSSHLSSSSSVVELEPHSNSSVVEFPAAPHITNISYSVVQPEGQPSPAISPCLSESPIPGDCSPSRYSSHSSRLLELQSEQQSEGRYKTPSPETGNQSILSLHCQSLSPHFNCNLSPASQVLEPILSETLSTDNIFDCCTFIDTSEEQKNLQSSIDVVGTENSTQPASPCILHSEDADAVVTKIRSVSPMSESYSPPSVSFLEEESTDTKRHVQSAVELGLDLYPENQDTNHCYSEGETYFKKSPTLAKYPITDPVNKNILPILKESTAVPVKKLEKPQPQCINYAQSSKSNCTFNTNLTPKPFRRQLSGKVGEENKSDLRENMASYVKKRRTPSPPLTRFTPVHIIAPEKPYRQWQARHRSPPQVKTSLPSANLKKAVTNTEIPHHDPVNNSQEDWCRERKPQEIERGLSLQESAIDQEQQDCGMYKERKREEHIPEKEEGRHGDASFREEQVELSFNAKNRKGPTGCSTAPTGRDTRPGLPTVHSYSESQLTRQPKQQPIVHRLSSQPDTKSGRLGRRLQSHITQHKSTTSGRVPTNKPGRSSSSSMGSELDEADHEVKWFTDVAFSSLSSPEIDYLDMYNSSHRSSTNVSQPSTQDSPAGVNTPWLSYADFRGSAQMLDSDELALQQSSAYYSDGLDPSRCYELGSFECVDVAVEKEDSRRVRRGVPKRQIQLKRRDTTESKQDESSENSSPGTPLLDNFSQDTHPREALLRQHSTPGSSQDPEPYEESSSIDKHLTLTKSKLQKSSSFDESCSKTKIATCLIKSILTKKMQSDELPGEEEPCDLVENIPTTKAKSSKSPKPDLLSSSLQSDCSLSSDTFGGRNDKNIKDEVGKQKSLRGKLGHRPSSTNSNRSVTFSIADSEETEAETRSVALQSELKETSCEELSDSKQMWKETKHDDSTNSSAGNSGPTPEAGASCTGHATMANREQECEKTQCQKQAQQGVLSSHTSKSPNSLSISSTEKKKASLNVCLTPEAENKPFTSDEKVEPCVNDKMQEQMVDKLKGPLHKVRDVRRLVKNTYNLSFKATGAFPSDEADNIFSKEQTAKENSGDVNQENNKRWQEVSHKETIELNEQTKDYSSIKPKEEKHLLQKEQTPFSHPMQIEYKAVCWKEDKNKTATDEQKKVVDTKPISDTPLYSVNETTIEDCTSVDCQSKGKVSAIAEKQHTVTLQPADKPMLGCLPKIPSKEREVSTAIVLIRDNSKTKRSASPSHEEFPSTVPASSPGLSSTPGSSGHSVSMLLKEKGYQADIGAVVGEGQTAGGSKSAPSKHVNCLEIPLQTSTESHRERTFSSSSSASGSTARPGNTETKTVEVESTAGKLDSTNKVHHLPPKSAAESTPSNKQGTQGDFEALKRIDPTFPPRSPAVRRFKHQSIEVKSTSKEANKQDSTTNILGSSRPQAIEVKSVAKNAQKPIVPPKPNCKFKPLDSGAMPSETQRLPPTSSKSHTEDRSQTIVVSSPTIYRKIPNDSTSNYTRKVAVSSVSSLKPPPSKPIAPSNVSVQPPPSETDIKAERQQRPGPPSQNSRHTQRHPTLPPAPAAPPSGPTISSSALFDATEHQHQAPAQTGVTQSSQTAVMDSNNQQPHLWMPYPHEPLDTSDNAQPAPVSITQGPGYIRQTYRRSLSNECSQKRTDMHFYASDDPPSYDERESFSPLRLPDLPPRSNRYQSSSRPACSCTASCPSHPGLPHPRNSPHNLTPPAPTHSPGHYVPQPAIRPHHCRSDPQPVTYQPSSPKASPLGPGPPQGLYQPLHQPPPCPPHPSLMHVYSAERPLPAQHMDPRRPPVHRSPQQPPAVMVGAQYPDQGHNHSPVLPHMDSHYLCGPQSLGPSYGSDYGGDSSSLYSESNYGQTPRRVLMDPETGKYFYIEVPVQPLRKMLFDPETGQYVEVLIPQQAMSHSSLYPPSAPNYPPLHNTNMYSPAAQYMPYAAPPAQPLPPRYPESSAAAPMHPHGPGVGYRNPSGQGSKPETQGHPPVDPNYLESMYYVPTGMNASPNTTPPDYYHKHPSIHPPSGGKRS